LTLSSITLHFLHLELETALDFAGKNVRDFIMATFGLGNLLVAILGLWMFLRRYRKQESK